MTRSRLLPSSGAEQRVSAEDVLGWRIQAGSRLDPEVLPMFLRMVVAVAIAAAAIPLAAQGAAAQTDLAGSVERQLPALTETYKHLHRNPELSRHEEQTSAFLAGELRKLGYKVTDHVGKYEDGSQAFGVVAVLDNGPGPRLLIRTDMDALPVDE